MTHVHALPAFFGLVLERVSGIEVFEIEILLVKAEDRKSPGDVFVVPEGDTRKARFARARDVPSRSDEMNHVAQRRQTDHAVRVVSQQGLAAVCQRAGNRPVVAAFGGAGRELDAMVAAYKVLEQTGSESRKVRAGCGVERYCGIEVEELRGLLRSHQSHRLCMLEFAESVAGHGKRGHAIEAVFGTPGVGRESGELEFDGQAGAAGRRQAGGVAVDAIGESGQDRQRVGRIALILSFHVTAIAQKTGIDIARQESRSEDFGQPSLSGALPKFHLKQPILRGDEALGKKEIVLILRINMGNAPAVAQDLDRVLQS
jgi:hypothetical protein